MTTGPRASLVAALVALAGCDELFEPEPPSDEALALAAAAVAAQAAEADSLPDEPHGESIEACLDRVRRETPASVQETIEAVGYSELLRDSCRARVAEDERSTVPCTQIEARLVRRSCESRVAIASRDPGLCPVSSAPGAAGGHDPLCLALASRDRSLCRAAPHLEREACRELLGESDACDESIAPDLCRDLVARQRRRLGAVEPIEEVAPATRLEPELVVSFVRVREGAPDEPVGTEEALFAFDRGARIHVQSGRTILELADPLGLSVVSHAGHPSVAIRVPLPPDDGADDARLEARVGTLAAEVEIAHPELGSLTARAGRVEIAHLSRSLGGRVEGRFSVTCPLAVGELRVEGHFRTFVRDVEMERGAADLGAGAVDLGAGADPDDPLRDLAAPTGSGPASPGQGAGSVRPGQP